MKHEKFDFSELLLYFLEKLDNKERKIFTFEELCYYITHIFNLNKESSRNTVRDLIKYSYLIEEEINGEILYKKNFEAENELRYYVNKKKVEEFRRWLGLTKLKRRKENGI